MNNYKLSLFFFLVAIIASDAIAQNNFQYRFELETPRLLNSTQQQITRNGDNYFFVHQDSTETGVVISVISRDGINTSNLFFTNLSNEPQLPVYTSTPSNLFSGSNRKSILLSNASAYDQSGVAFKYYVNFNVIDSTGAPILFKTWKIEQNSISNMHVSDAVLSSDEQYIFACALLSDSTGIPVESALIKSDWSGQIQWVRSWPANNYYLPAITVDNQNNIYMSEYNSLVTGTKIMKWNSAGSLIWEKQFTPNVASSLVFYDMSFNQVKNRLGLAGTFTDNATMKWSPMMLEVDSAGNFIPTFECFTSVLMRSAKFDTTYAQLEKQTDSLVSLKKKRIQEVSKRKIVSSKEWTVKKDKITLQIWDNNKEDGDIISLKFNDTWILTNFQLKKEKYIIHLDLKSKNNQLLLFAENLGSIPPNTAAISIDDDDLIRTFILNSDMSKSETVKIILDKPKK